MEHTWQSNHLPKLEIANLEKGDIAVCGSFATHTPILPALDADRVCFVTPLGSRSDLEWLLRGLHLHPAIRHLIICGDDVKATGEALLALWRAGLDESGRLPTSRGRLSAELDPVVVNSLRDRVEVWDLRGKPLGEVTLSIEELDQETKHRTRAEETNGRVLPNPTIPDRRVFLSRKTTFPIFSSSVGDSWLQLLNLALRIGTEKRTASGERMAEALNAVVTIETPVLEDGEQEDVGEEFPAFLDFNRDDFDRFYFPYYSDRLRARDETNQLEAVCDRLRTSLDTRSGTMVFLEPSDMGSSLAAPDLISATFNSVDRKLFASFVLRTSDVYTDWPLEAMALARLQRDTADRLGLEVGTTTFVVHSAHLYERDWDRSQRVLKESFKRPLPLHVDPSGVFLFGNDGGKARAMLLNHDASEIQWEDAFGDPEDLSWYIVDVMPWLLPQHIRYVGQECASLMRAMQEKECYLQG
jgi:thymidylate synthase